MPAAFEASVTRVILEPGGQVQAPLAYVRAVHETGSSPMPDYCSASSVWSVPASLSDVVLPGEIDGPVVSVYDALPEATMVVLPATRIFACQKYVPVASPVVAQA